MSNYQAIVQSLKNLDNTVLANTPVAVRAKYIAFVIGAALAFDTDLPTTPVTSAVNHFIINHQQNAEEIVARINEECVINYTLAIQTAREMYHYRYRMVFDAEFIFQEVANLALASFNAIPPAMADVVKEVDSATSSSVISQITQLVRDIKEERDYEKADKPAVGLVGNVYRNSSMR